jgi:serine protease AprX
MSHHLLRPTLTLAVVLACSVAAAPDAHAQRRARLSADLADPTARGASVDVIVHGTPEQVQTLAGRYNLRVKRQLRSGAVLQVTPGQLEALETDGTQEHLSSDAPVRAMGDVTAATIGLDRLLRAEGLGRLSGKGIGVAVIDSGIDPTHVALAGRVVAAVDFTGGNGSDGYGHGTHVASIIAGQGGRTADTAEYAGIAGGAHIVNLRVLGNDGSGVVSSVMEAIDWAVEHRNRFNIQVINLSLGAPVLQSYRDDPLCEAVERALAAGMVVVAAAGNHGVMADGRRVLGSVTSPGNHPGVITVGALDTKQTAARGDDNVAIWSSRGPTMYDLVLKPDLVAPGTRVVGAEAAGSLLAKQYPQRHVGGSGVTGYIQLSGTSMAAGVVSGSVALLLDQRSRLSARDAKTALQLTSSFLPGDGVISGGSGSVNLAATAYLLELVKHQRRNRSGSPERRALARVITDSIKGSGGRAAAKSLVWGNALVGVSRVASSSMTWGVSLPDSIVWGNAIDSIVWGNFADSIVWGNGLDSIVWGNLFDSIVWGNSTDSIVWGNFVDSIVWGNSTDSIVWGNSADSIVWGNFVDSIVWGNAADSIVWGNATDSIVWGNFMDSIVWGNATDSIVWGNSSDSIVWGNSIPDDQI